MSVIRNLLMGGLLAIPLAAAGQAPVFQSEAHTIRAVTVSDGLEHPWGLAFLPDGGILVTERPGRLRLIRDGELVAEPVAGTPEVFARAQGGLLDIALHPAFEDNRLVYLSYAKPGDRGATTAVMRGRLEDHALHDTEEIFVAEAWAPIPVHFGSRLVFDRDGYLYVTVGDRGMPQRAQDPSDHAGVTLRLRDDGTVPDSNPLHGKPDHHPAVYTWGNRNSQGMAVHPETGEIWQSEHGPKGGDELNRMRAGHNYGWPVVTHGIDYDGSVISDKTDKPGMEPPVVHWTPSIGTSGLAIYAGDAFAGWRGDMFIGGLATKNLSRVTLDEDGAEIRESLLDGLGERIRDVRVGPDGLLYLLVDRAGAPLLRLEPAD